MKSARKIALSAAATLVVLYALYMVTYYATSLPKQFCVTCHYLRPYVESWQESAHAGVNCMHCHEMRGFVGKLHSKARGLNYVYQHITGQYTVPVQGIVFEQNCIGCHLSDYRRFQGAPILNNENADHYNIIRGNRSCLECHRGTGHDTDILLRPDFAKLWKR